MMGSLNSGFLREIQDQFILIRQIEIIKECYFTINYIATHFYLYCSLAELPAITTTAHIDIISS